MEIPSMLRKTLCAGNRRQHIADEQAEAAQSEQHQRPRGKDHVIQKGQEKSGADTQTEPISC